MLRFIVGILLGAVVVVFILQNVQVVDFVFLGWTVSMSRAILFIVMILVGFILGLGAGSIGGRRRRR
jgi:uncharacterized integral membrane protein